MTSPTSGEGQRLEYSVAHSFLRLFEEIAGSAELYDNDPKLPTFTEKLPTLSKSRSHSEPFSALVPSSISNTPFTSHRAIETLSDLALSFTVDELSRYVASRRVGLADKSCDWINRSAKLFWYTTSGVISQRTIELLRTETLDCYDSSWSHGKTLSFAKAFLKYLTKTHLDTRYAAFEVFLEMPKAVKNRKAVTCRIVTKGDIESVLAHIKHAAIAGDISRERARQYTAFVLLGAYSGQRSMATIARLTTGQLREALRRDKPVLHVTAKQDKIRMEHYVPIHPVVVRSLKPLFDGKKDPEPLFEYNSFQMWIKRAKISMSRFKGHFVLGDLRKFAEQEGDVIGWDSSNRAYVLTHGVSGVDWSHYKHPLPEHVYDIYMRYWRDVTLK